MSRVARPGSVHRPAPGARRLDAAPHPDTVLPVTVVLHPAEPLPTPGGPPRPPLTHHELATRHGAHPAHVEQVVAFAAAHGLALTELRPGERIVKLSGTVAQLEQAFGVTLERWELADGRRHHSHTGPLTLPAALDPLVMAVLGLDDRPIRAPRPAPAATPRPAASGWWPSGGSVDTNVESTSDQWATWRGRAVDLCLTYNTPSSGWSAFLPASGQPAAYTSPNHRLVIQTPPFPTGMGNTYSALIAGSYDSHWTQFGTDLAAQDTAAGRLPTIVDIAWEANGSYFPWGYNSGQGEQYTSASQYIAGFRRIATVLRAAYPSVQIGWIPNGHGNPMAASSIFPGAAYVDYIGVDYYDMFPPSLTQSAFTSLANTVDEGILWYLSLCQTYGKQLLVPEWGVVHDTTNGGGDNANYITWMVGVFQQAQTAGLMGGETYFTYEQSGLVNGQNPQSAARYQALYAAPPSDSGLTNRPGPNYLTAPEIAKLYNYPPDVDGSGQTLGVIMLDSGTNPASLAAYFGSLGQPARAITYVFTDGQTNNPAGPDAGELMFDLEIAGSAAPGAKLVAYLGVNTGAGWLDITTAAVHDAVNTPSVLTVSLLLAEAYVASDWYAAMETVYHAATLLGITCLAASGDWGSTGNDTSDGLAHAGYPASSEWVLSVGGTVTTGSADHTAIVSEVAWNASGGGISDLAALPSWQSGAGIPASVNPGGRVGRGMPDVAAQATWYWYWALGASAGSWLGGTSGGSPQVAALIVRMVQKLGYRVGHLHEFLYAHPSVCRDITTQDVVNPAVQAYTAHAGWDALTGLGVLDGGRVTAALYAARLIAAVNAAGRRIDLTLHFPQFPSAYIWRITPSGRTLLTGPVTLTAGAWTGSDTSAPVGVPVSYVAIDATYQASAAFSNTVTLAAPTTVGISQAFLDALRGPHVMDIRAIPYLGGTPVAIPGYPDGLPITGGAVTVDSTQRIRRQLAATIAADPALVPWLATDLLSGANGVEIFVQWGMVFPDGSVEWCPLGLFHIEETDTPVSGAAAISITQASDRGGYVTDYRFTDATQSIVGATVSSEITRLLGLAIPPGAVNTTASVTGDTTTVAALLTWTSSDRWAAIGQLEDAIGVTSYFDASGYPTVRPVATPADAAVWQVDSGATGVMVEATRKTGRTQTYNGVVVRGQRLDGTLPVQATVLDTDVTSRTYWSGPFGKKPRFYTSPLITDSGQAASVGATLLGKVTGWTRQIVISGPGNPALDADNVITVVYPDGSTESHIIDRVTIPLTPDGAQEITTRTYTPPSE